MIVSDSDGTSIYSYSSGVTRIRLCVWLGSKRLYCHLRGGYEFLLQAPSIWYLYYRKLYDIQSYYKLVRQDVKIYLELSYDNLIICPARYLCGFISKLTGFSFSVEIPFGYSLYTANYGTLRSPSCVNLAPMNKGILWTLFDSQCLNLRSSSQIPDR